MNRLAQIGVRFSSPGGYVTPVLEPIFARGLKENITWSDRLVGDTERVCDCCYFHEIDVTAASARLFANSIATSKIRCVVFESASIHKEATAFLNRWKPEGLLIQNTMFPQAWREAIIHNSNIQYLKLKGKTGFKVDELRSMADLRTLVLDEVDLTGDQIEEISNSLADTYVFLCKDGKTKVLTSVKNTSAKDAQSGLVGSRLAELEKACHLRGLETTDIGLRTSDISSFEHENRLTLPCDFKEYLGLRFEIEGVADPIDQGFTKEPATILQCVESLDESGQRYLIQPVEDMWFSDYEIWLPDFRIVQLVEVGSVVVGSKKKPLWIHSGTGEILYGSCLEPVFKIDIEVHIGLLQKIVERGDWRKPNDFNFVDSYRID